MARSRRHTCIASTTTAADDKQGKQPAKRAEGMQMQHTLFLAVRPWGLLP